ncbi:P-loop ATPase, Sll1717 family [Micromonospora sp. CNB394]|uniref:P-loop ATPase, Sll1717 family n=1 Tax=Micromonospora sp. CNB394 TaxID=1169151 RepID=UPI0012DE9F65|nr:hypothetical protein [Micromonospora sp. CNB394]
MTPEQLQKIDFGRLDAESDPRLQDYFLVTGTVDVAKRGAKLVIGRKGSGKTALFLYLKQNLDTDVVDLDLNDYVFGMHQGLVEAGLSAERAYVASWKLLIYSAVFGKIRESMSSSDRGRGDDLLASLGQGDNGGRFRKIVRWLKRLRRVDLPSVLGTGGGGIEIGDKATLSMDTIDRLDDLEDLLCKQVEKIPVTVLLDRLDDAWDGTQESLNLIGGAIRATRDIAIAWQQPTPAPVITFLRTDLWERLSFNDKNKMSQDIIYLDWTRGQLADIVDLRINNSIGIPVGKGWETVFTTGEMRQRAQAQTYIIKRTLGRPRDVVSFATYALKAATTNGHAQIEASDIYEAEKEYSKHMLGELRDEIERHVSDWNSVTNSLKALGKRNFTTGHWLSSCGDNGIGRDNALRALEQLFEASAVGIHGVGGTRGGTRGGSGTTYRYQDRHLQSRPDATLQVHLALVRELRLKDA